MNSAAAHLSFHACPRRLGTNASSIHLKPELRLDGTPVATGPGMGAGSEPVGQGGYTRYGQQDWDETQDPLIAGQQTAIGLSIQGISQAQRLCCTKPVR